jgi:hypothetical protein
MLAPSVAIKPRDDVRREPYETVTTLVFCVSLAARERIALGRDVLRRQSRELATGS